MFVLKKKWNFFYFKLIFYNFSFFDNVKSNIFLKNIYYFDIFSNKKYYKK
jgi:hypothetical protein